MATPDSTHHGLIHKIGTAMRIVRMVKNWPLLWASKLGLMADDRVLAARFRDGLNVSFRRKRDEIQFGEVFVLECYRHPALAWGDLATVVDIGANVGMFSLWMSRQSPRAQYLLFEPEPESACLARQNLDANPSVRGKILEHAISGRSGTVRFYVDHSNSGGSGMLPPREHAYDQTVVPSRTLNDLFEDGTLRGIDLLKVDCEGSEYEIFESLKPTGWARISQVVVEVHDVAGRSPASIGERLANEGFEVYSGCGTNLVWARKPRGARPAGGGGWTPRKQGSRA